MKEFLGPDDGVTFQSTCPRGHDACAAAKYTACNAFNPRAHEGTTAQAQFKTDNDCPFNPRAHEGTTL